MNRIAIAATLVALLVAARPAVAMPDAKQAEPPCTAAPHTEPVEPEPEPPKEETATPQTPPAPTTNRPEAPARRIPLDTIADWETFLREFRAAIARRDREALRSCMPKNFLFTLGPLGRSDPRDAAFYEWDRPDIRGWEAIERVLAKGTVTDPLVPGLKVAPPEWVTNPRYTDYRLGFERQGKFWRWVWSMRGN